MVGILWKFAGGQLVTLQGHDRCQNRLLGCRGTGLCRAGSHASLFAWEVGKFASCVDVFKGPAVSYARPDVDSG